MSKQALEALVANFTALEQKLDAALKPADKPGATDKPTDDNKTDDYSALADKIENLTKQWAEQFSSLLAKLEAGTGRKDDGKAEDKPADQYAQLAAELKKLREDFNQALEGNGTDAGEHLGDTDDYSNYL